MLAPTIHVSTMICTRPFNSENDILFVLLYSNHPLVMKKILVPTDFSDNAFIAARYAAEMAIKYHYHLHIIHFYTALSSTFEEDDIVEDLKHPDLLKADITIEKWANKLQSEYPDLSLSYKNERGLLEEGLTKEATSDDYIAIAMGTTGASAKKNIFWGSNTSLIVARSPIPVLVVPNIENIGTDIQNIGLLTNFKQEELTTLQEFVHIFKQEVEVSLIHVYKENENLLSVNNRLDTWSFNVGEFSAVRHTHKRIAPTLKDDKDQDTIPEVISKLIDAENIDIILVSKTRKTFFKRLFTSSISKAMTLRLQKPAFFGKTT